MRLELILILFIIFNLINQIEQSLVSNIFDQSSNDIFFQIRHPESLRYTYRAKGAAFGPPFNETLELALRIVEPNNACTTIINKLELKNNIGLIQRGSCSFLDKCIEAERSGLRAILVYDNNLNDDKYLDMISDSTKRNCSIPAAYVLGKDGIMIKRKMLYLGLEHVNIIIPVNVSKLDENEDDEIKTDPWTLF